MATSFDPTEPFTRAAAIEAGVTVKQLRGPRYRPIFRDVYIDAGVAPSPQLRAEAALLLHHESAAASHASAARIEGLPIPTFPEEHVTVLEPMHRRRRAGIVCHYLPRHRSHVKDGVRVSTPEQMFVEMGTLLALVDHVVLGDAMVRRGLATPTELSSFAAAATGHGAASSRQAAGHVRRGVDSPMETRLRMLLLLAGIPEPDINKDIRDVRGEPRRRFDLSWPAARTVVEYDGRQHIERKETWESDLARREASESDGWRMLVFVSSDIFKTPGRTIERVWSTLRDRQLPGLPARPGDGWRPHFPGW